MEMRADLGQPARVAGADWDWVESPQAGVSRVMLDRVGDEVAVATSFVRYTAGSHFPSHDHAKGEEFLVLEGEFGDEHGRYPPISYVRNPPGSHHAPFSEPGCLIWVKLRQFQAADLTQRVAILDTEIPQHGHQFRQLHEFGPERVGELVLAAGESLALPACELPQELLVLAGEVLVDEQPAQRWDWLRVPAGQGIGMQTTEPSRLFWKTRPEV